jgi:phenylpropionate dioxygenase-like ring-hydroxylating dioxygenase large terminal subunit
VKTLRERDGRLVDHWYIACLSRELRSNAPLARTIYDARLVLFRDAAGRAVAMPDACLHRLAPLSAGTVRDGCLVCPYHGWTYEPARPAASVRTASADGFAADSGTSGTARRPAASVHTAPAVSFAADDGGRAGSPPRLRLPPLPVIEQDGCVWVWMGEGEPVTAAPPFRFPHVGERGWVTYFMVTDFANEVTHLVDNFMDVPHTAYVHRGWFRRPSQKPVPIRVEASERDVLVTYDQTSDEIGFTARILNPRREAVRHTDHFLMPNLTRVDYEFGSRKAFIICSECTPVGAFATRVYTQIAYRLPLGRLLAPFFRFYTRRVIEQDVTIMRQQGENLRRLPEARFCHTPSDVIHQSIERLREAAARGEPPPEPQVSEQVIWV